MEKSKEISEQDRDLSSMFRNNPLYLRESRFATVLDLKATPKDPWDRCEWVSLPERITKYLRDSIAIHGYGQLCRLEMAKEQSVDRYIKVNYNLSELFTKIGCESLLEGSEIIYPELVRQFYANGSFTNDRVWVRSLVKGIEMKFDYKMFGDILGISTEGLDIDDVDLAEAKPVVFKEQVFRLDDMEFDTFEMFDKAKVINRLCLSNVYPKILCKHKVRKEVVKFIYCVLEGKSCNVAKLMFSRFMDWSSFMIFFPGFLTKVFRHFNVDLNGEEVWVNHLSINQTIVLRMLAEVRIVEKEDLSEEEVMEIVEVNQKNIQEKLEEIEHKVEFSLIYMQSAFLGIDKNLKALAGKLRASYFEFFEDLPEFDDYDEAKKEQKKNADDGAGPSGSKKRKA